MIQGAPVRSDCASTLEANRGNLVNLVKSGLIPTGAKIDSPLLPAIWSGDPGL